MIASGICREDRQTQISHYGFGKAGQAAEKRLTEDSHPGAQGATSPESGEIGPKNSPPQIRRGLRVVLTRG
jgi:hypothetical protein